MAIALRPDRIRSFGSPEGASFCFITNSAIAADFKLEESGDYAGVRVLHHDASASLEYLFSRDVPEDAHVLVVSPHCFVESPRPEVLGPRRKLIAMPCGSTPVEPAALAHFLDALVATDPEAQQARADRFFEALEASEHLSIVDPRYETEARFGHRSREYEWNEQVGVVDWGEQQIAPSGELSALPADIMNYDPDLRVDLNGTLALRGPSIVHSGKPSFLAADQRRMHAAFAAASEHAVIATVEDGMLVSFQETDPASRPAREMLEALCTVDSRYRIVWEMGFGINTHFEPWPGNCGMNEPYGAESGVFHLGVGLTPFTQYAPIFMCLGSQIQTSHGEVILGGMTRRRIKRSRGASCGCHS